MSSRLAGATGDLVLKLSKDSLVNEVQRYPEITLYGYIFSDPLILLLGIDPQEIEKQPMVYIPSKPLRSTLQKCVQLHRSKCPRLVYMIAYYLTIKSYHYNQQTRDNVEVHSVECNKLKQKNK